MSRRVVLWRVHGLNAPSPAATASLAIAREIVDRVPELHGSKPV